MSKRSPDRRLLACAEYARPGKRFADIGTDHAILPVYLCLHGISPGGRATDINRGPLSRAVSNIAAAGLGDRIECRLADGLDGIEGYHPDDIFILGMGGELIAEILSGSDYIKKRGVRLVLQPMTHPQDLRRFLSESGFDITGETLVSDRQIPEDCRRVPAGIRIYQVICAEYVGVKTDDHRPMSSFDPEITAELLLGRINIGRDSRLVRELAARYAAGCEKAIEGLKAGGKDVTNELGLLRVLNRISGKLRQNT